MWRLSDAQTAKTETKHDQGGGGKEEGHLLKAKIKRSSSTALQNLTRTAHTH